MESHIENLVSYKHISPYNKPAIPFQSIYPREMKTYVCKKTCTGLIHNSQKLDSTQMTIKKHIYSSSEIPTQQ